MGLRKAEEIKIEGDNLLNKTGMLELDKPKMKMDYSWELEKLNLNNTIKNIHNL